MHSDDEPFPCQELVDIAQKRVLNILNERGRALQGLACGVWESLSHAFAIVFQDDGFIWGGFHHNQIADISQEQCQQMFGKGFFAFERGGNGKGVKCGLCV